MGYNTDGFLPSNSLTKYGIKVARDVWDCVEERSALHSRIRICEKNTSAIFKSVNLMCDFLQLNFIKL